MTKQEQRDEAYKAYKATSNLAQKALRAIENPAWDAYKAKLKEINEKE